MEERDLLAVQAVFAGSERLASPASGTVRARSRKRRSASWRRVSDYFGTLSRAVEEANRRLALRSSRFRFCVYRKGKRVYIDVAEVDAATRRVTVETRDITEADFGRCIDDLANARGLYVDELA